MGGRDLVPDVRMFFVGYGDASDLLSGRHPKPDSRNARLPPSGDVDKLGFSDPRMG